MKPYRNFFKRTVDIATSGILFAWTIAPIDNSSNMATFCQ